MDVLVRLRLLGVSGCRCHLACIGSNARLSSNAKPPTAIVEKSTRRSTRSAGARKAR
jgi:hypothetical protein